jgi:hypothetical protein
MGLKYQIIIEIDEDDNITLETKGFKGPDCVSEIKKVTKEIATIESSKKTKEYYEKQQSKLKKKISRFSK